MEKHGSEASRLPTDERWGSVGSGVGILSQRGKLSDDSSCIGGGNPPPGGTNPHRLRDKGSRTLAIDIGRNGALALFDAAGALVAVEDMPTLDDGPASRPTVNGPLLASIVKRWAPTCAVVEHVAARPGEAASGSFAFGRSRGAIEGVLAAHAIPVRFVTPAWWKRRNGIPAGTQFKDLARSKAIANWPDRADLFARKADHDRAEAALIGLAFITEGERR